MPRKSFELRCSVYRGEADKEAKHPSTLALRQNKNFFCTGAKISERLILTAAHCLFDNSGMKQTLVKNESVSVSNSADLVFTPKWISLKVTDVYFSPSFAVTTSRQLKYKAGDDLTSEDFRSDVGLITVKPSAEFAEIPTAEIDVDTLLHVNNESIDVGGFGTQGYDSEGKQAGAARILKWDTKKVAFVTPQSYLLTTFQDEAQMPKVRADGTFGAPPSSMFGSGDSGGPSFLNGTQKIIGVVRGYDSLLRTHSGKKYWHPYVGLMDANGRWQPNPDFLRGLTMKSAVGMMSVTRIDKQVVTDIGRTLKSKVAAGN